MSDLIAALRQALGDEAVLVGDDVALRSDTWGSPERCQAKAIVRPTDTDGVSATLRICHQSGQPVVVHGGLTGLVGGARSSTDDVALSLERMTAIEEVDSVGRTMTVQAGVALQAIQERAEEEGLLFPLDLGARGSCQIGGNVSTNAGGNRVIRYGMTRRLVLGLEAVLADGTVLSSMNRMLKNNAGYDLKQLFIGSEGTLGIVTRVVLRLERQPRSQNMAFAAIDDFDRLTSFLRAVEEGLSGTLSAFEVMWEDFYRLVTTEPAKNRPPLEYGHPYYVLVESLGAHQERDDERFEEVLGGCLEGGLLADAVLARSRSERQSLWAMRDDVEQLGRLAPIFTYDVSLPIQAMKGYVEGVREALAQRWDDPHCVVFGHLGDGNLHVIAGVGAGDLETRRRVEEIVYRPLSDVGGSVAAEHGIGLEKRPYLSWSRSEAEIEVMRALKKALDPSNILNPGKVLG